MTEPTDYERGLRDGIMIGRPYGALDVFWWAGLLLCGVAIGAVLL